MPSREDIFEHLKTVLVDLFETDPAKITPEASLYSDLDIDSIDAIDLVLTLKEYTGKKIQPEEFKSVRTVGDVVSAIQSIMSQ